MLALVRYECQCARDLGNGLALVKSREAQPSSGSRRRNWRTEFGRKLPLALRPEALSQGERASAAPTPKSQHAMCALRQRENGSRYCAAIEKGRVTVTVFGEPWSRSVIRSW